MNDVRIEVSHPMGGPHTLLWVGELETVPSVHQEMKYDGRDYVISAIRWSLTDTKTISVVIVVKPLFVPEPPHYPEL